MNNLEKESSSEEYYYKDWKAPKTGTNNNENVINSINNILMKHGVSFDQKERISFVYEGLKDRDKEEFIALLSGYIEFKQSEGKFEGVEKPLVHGTGSYSAKKIIQEGFRPRRLSEIVTGEKSLLKNEDKDNIIPVSFCDPTFENGIDISHYYATQVSSEKKLNNDLSINSENYLGNKTYQLLEHIYGGIDKVVNDDVKRRELKVKEKMGDQYREPTQEQIEMSKQISREIILNKYKMLEADDAFIYDPKKNKQNIEKLHELLDPNKKMGLDEARKLFLESGILNGEINYQNLPYYEIDKIVEGLIDGAHTEGKYIRKKIQDLLRDKIASENDISRISPEDAKEIKNQFPVYFLLEGEGKDLVEFKDVTKAREYRCGQIVENNKIKQIQVPKKFISEVKEWLRGAGLDEDIVVPFEYYEMDQIIKNKK